MQRSLLFIPGNRENMLWKAGSSAADAVIFDLEDSVAEDDKSSARETLRNFLASFGRTWKKRTIVRINSGKAAWREDLTAVADQPCVNAVMIPKATVSSIEAIDDYLRSIELKNDLLARRIKFIPMIESPKGLLDARQIAGASTRIIGMLFGAEDYTAEMGIERTEGGEEIYVARCVFAMACHSAGIEAYDTPFTNIKDLKALKRDALTAKAVGMTGKAVIHPAHLETINDVFLPSPEEIRQALRILKENEIAKRNGKGSFSLDGKMVDSPVVLRAEQVLEGLDPALIDSLRQSETTIV